MSEPKINAATANRIYDILVTTCRAYEGMRDQFVYYQTTNAPDICREWRFGGTLGFGGKFRRYTGRWYVDCYREDETTERTGIIAEANRQLAALMDEMKEPAPAPTGKAEADAGWLGDAISEGAL